MLLGFIKLSGGYHGPDNEGLYKVPQRFFSQGLVTDTGNAKGLPSTLHIGL